MHATAGTFAFKRKLLDQTKYDDEAELAEEKAFLKNYTVPLVQLDPLKSILCFAHQYNTFDKKKVIKKPQSTVCSRDKFKTKYFLLKIKKCLNFM